MEKSDTMTPETKRALRVLFKKIALVCVLLAIVTALCGYFIADANGKLLLTVLAALAAGGSGYYFASAAPLWVAMPWLKGMLCILAILAGVSTFAVAGAMSVFAYSAVNGTSSSSVNETSSSGRSSGGFKSWD